MAQVITSKLLLCHTLFLIPKRMRSKHWIPKWKRLRAEKVIKVDLPNYNEKYDELPPEKIRQKLKERGLLPVRQWMERQYYVASTADIFEPYVPPEGDGKASFISATRAKQSAEILQKKSKSMMAIRKVKSFDEDFDTNEFCKIAQDIYIKAHESLINKDRHQLRTFVTEKAYAIMRENTLDKTMHWKFLESLEPPRIVHARYTDLISKDNIFGQITVRFHTRQQLAIYDRFGRLFYGSEILAKDVLEYVVFEKHLSNTYGTWRIHDKIIPDWAPPREPSKMTKLKEETKPVEDEVVPVKAEATQVQADTNTPVAVA